MRKLLFGLLLTAACAHQAAQAPAPGLRSELMDKCTAFCSPGDALAAAVVVASHANDLWQCLCRPAAAATGPASEPAFEPGT